MTLTQCTTALRRTYREAKAASDMILNANTSLWNMRFSECLAAVPSSIRDRYITASKARDEAEYAAVSAGYCYRESSTPSLLWWVKTKHRVGLVSFD